MQIQLRNISRHLEPDETTAKPCVAHNTKSDVISTERLNCHSFVEPLTIVSDQTHH